MRQRSFSLRDHDGTLCVCEDFARPDRPEIVTNYYPTMVRTYDLARHYYDDLAAEDRSAMVATIQVREDFAGCFTVVSPNRHQADLTVFLRDGGKTIPCHSTTRPATRPKRHPRARYDGGWWHIPTRSGGLFRTIDPLTV